MAKSYIASYQVQDLANNSGTIKALSLNHSRQSAVEGPLSKERRSSEARQRRASLLVIYNIGITETGVFLLVCNFCTVRHCFPTNITAPY